MRPGYRLILLLFISLTSQADEDGSQYSRLDQINTGNASQVELAFSHRNGDLGRGFPGKGHSFQATPVYWQGALYFSTSANLVIAIDAGSGTERWRFDPQLPRISAILNPLPEALRSGMAMSKPARTEFSTAP